MKKMFNKVYTQLKTMYENIPKRSMLIIQIICNIVALVCMTIFFYYMVNYTAMFGHSNISVLGSILLSIALLIIPRLMANLVFNIIFPPEEMKDDITKEENSDYTYNDVA